MRNCIIPLRFMQIFREMKMSEYQAVVMAGGRGTRMVELTNTIPKCLLPVANLPMIVYPLLQLQNANFHDAIVLVPARCVADIRRVLVECNVQIRIDLVEVPDDDDLGTAEVLQLIASRINKDLLIISCDFVSDFNLNKFLDWHETKASSMSILLAPNSTQGVAPGPRSKKKSEKDLFGIESNTNRMVFMCGEADLEDDHVNLHRNLLVKYPNINFSTKWTDCHLYILNKYLIDVLNVCNDMNSLKADFLPYVINLQQLTTTSMKPEVQEILKQQNLISKKNLHENKILCLAYTMNADEFTLCSRMNTTGTYFETNKQVIKILPKLNRPSISPSTPRPHVGTDSVVGHGCNVADKCQVKRSVIGKQCSLADKCKVNNSLVMDHVRIGENANLTNCIVCHSAEIGEKCELKDCFVGTNQRVAPGAKITAEIIGEGSKMMEI